MGKQILKNNFNNTATNKRLIFYLLIFLLLIFIISSMNNSHKVLSAAENQIELDFSISTEEITDETMIPMRQFKEHGMDFYEVDDGKIIMNRGDNILFVNTESNRINLSGRSIQPEKNPLIVNNDLLLPYHVVADFMGEVELKYEAEEVEKDIEPARNVKLQAMPEAQEVTEEKESLNIKLKLVNNTRRLQRFTFNTGQKYDLKVNDEKDNTVYHWSEGKMFIQAIQTLQLGPGENKTWEVEVPLEDLSPGKYKLDAWLTNRGRRIRADGIKLEIN